MPANTAPIFPITPLGPLSPVQTAANTNRNGTGTVATVATAGAYGMRIDKVRFTAQGANAPSVARLYVNNGNDPTIASNNAIIAEVALPQTQSSTTEESGPLVEVELGLSLPASFKLTWHLGSAVAGGWQAYPFGGQYE